MDVFKVTWSEEAAVSLREIHDFIKKSSPTRAKKVLKDLIKAGMTLQKMPNRNPIEPLLIDEPVIFRFLVKWNYKLIYTVQTDVVLIVEVFDTRRDPAVLRRGF